MTIATAPEFGHDVIEFFVLGDERIDIGIDAWMSLAQLISTSPRISQLTSFDDIAVPAGPRNWNGNGSTSPCAARHGPCRTRNRSHT